MILIIGQCVEADHHEGARQLFDVLETLLILVSKVLHLLSVALANAPPGNPSPWRPHS